jgi:hypothetical protein
MRYQGQGLTVQMKLSTLERRTGELQVTVSGSATRWRLRRTEAGLRLGLVRAFGTDQFTWADLLRVPLSGAQVYALYFPSRFDLPVDGAVEESLRVFGNTTSNKTSVDFWDPRDEHFSEALELFGLRNPPALVKLIPAGRRIRCTASASLIKRFSLTVSSWLGASISRTKYSCGATARK